MIKILRKIRDIFIGLPRNPFDSSNQKNVALIAFLAWVGLGADGLSSSCYGPEQSFLALGQHYNLALYLAILTALTVFIIAAAYNQVIELFPTGGGGYKVATKLIGPYVGLVSGAALIVDYVLTIAISVASGVDQAFSLMPNAPLEYRIYVDIALVLVLMILNLRGIKESILVLMPIFIGFIVSHFTIFIFGIGLHGSNLGSLFGDAVNETHSFVHEVGWFVVIALFLRAYSLGGGTYTGLEAVSNNVNHLAEPRVRTGRWTMFYMALSLSLTAGSIILLYLLWDVRPEVGQTLNAIVFRNILGDIPYHGFLLMLLLLFETGLLIVAANTGFLAGPTVLANMAVDGWIPKRFRNLSTRLVTQNGIVLFGIAAIVILLRTHGEVAMLVVLYSMNVFITFSLSLLGICIYWWRHKERKGWFFRLLLSLLGLTVCLGILIITLLEKFTSGGWLTVLITSSVIIVCILIKQHYVQIKQQIRRLDRLLTLPLKGTVTHVPEIDPQRPTAVFLIGETTGQGMHTLLSAQSMFPDHFRNFIFMSVGVVDIGSYGSDKALKKMQESIEERMKYFIQFSQEHGFAATSFIGYDNDPVKGLTELAEVVIEQFPNAVFFADTVISKQDNWFHRQLHSDVPTALQHNLHLKGLQMIILPVKLDRNAK